MNDQKFINGLKEVRLTLWIWAGVMFLFAVIIGKTDPFFSTVIPIMVAGAALLHEFIRGYNKDV